MSAPMRWGLSVLDWRSHAINELGEHPLGMFTAECGHLLMMVTTLHEKPSGEPCQACATLQLARAVTDGSGRIHPPRSGDGEPDGGEPDPQAWITDVGDCGHRRVRSNPAPIGPCPDCAPQIGAPGSPAGRRWSLAPSCPRRPVGPPHQEIDWGEHDSE